MPKNPKFNDTLYNSAFLQRLYIEEDRNASQIAVEIGCTPGAVLDALVRFGIPKKSASDVQKLLPHPGSHASRVKQTDRERFGATLYSEEWVQARSHLNASEIAREAGCSVPTAQAAMAKFGITPPSISYAKAGRAAIHKRKKEGELVSRATASRRANQACPQGPCVICGDAGEHVNHIDRDWQNSDPRNLERLCPICHKWQHSCETYVMIYMLAQLGVPYVGVWQEARERIQDGTFAPLKRTPGKLTIGDETRGTSEWALRAGIREATLRGRLELGWDPERAVTEPVHEPEPVTVDGITDTITQHALRHGIPVGNVFSRLHAGWSLERALKTEIR